MAWRARPRALFTIALVALAPVLVCPTAWAQPRSVRTALAVHWSSEDYPSNPVVDGAIRQVLLSHDEAPVDYFSEYLESDRFPDESATLAFRDYLQRKYQGRRIDVVLAITDPALQFVLDYRDQLFPGVPVVASASSTLSVHLAAAGVTGTAWRAADVETIELALSLHPSTQRVFVVAQELTPGYLEGVQAALAKSAEGVELRFINERSVPGLIAAVRAVPAGSLIHIIRYSQQDPGNVMFPNEVVRMVAEASPVPVYVSTDSHVGTGVVGGVVRRAAGIGTRIGEIALQVLDGTRAQDIPIENMPALPIFDWRQLQRWGISERSLPAGSVLQFRELSMWERNKTGIILTASIFLLQSTLIAALLLERRNRRRSEIALRESEERAEIAGVSLGVGFWTWQPDNDRVWTTRQCAWLLGTEMGKRLTLDELLHALRPRIDEPVDSAFEQAVRSGTAFDGELPVERDDGSVRWIIAAIRPSADSRGRRHITGVLMDVTARKNAELLAAEQLRELTHLGRVAMLGEMSGTLSHELRQPLAAILTCAQATRRLVDQQPADLDRVRHGLDAIVKAEKHAGSVIDRIRAMLKRNDPQPEALDINEVVRETLELAALELRSRAVAPSTYLERSLPMVFGDRIQLQQVLINLVLNACDAMSEVAPPYRRMAVTTWYHEEKVQILVRDAGTGISEDRIDRIFEPFMTTKQDGLGLGLAICHSIVRAHGGDIRAVNNPDGGSTFQILLPRGTREATSGETSTKGLPKDSMRIVVVDDDEEVRMALQSLLRASGHEVRVFASAEDLLAQEVVADCFLFDVCLPKMSGIELAGLIRSAGSDVPIVLMTGHDRGSFERAIRQSGLPLVSKPCDEEEILNAVASRKR